MSTPLYDATVQAQNRAQRRARRFHLITHSRFLDHLTVLGFVAITVAVCWAGIVILWAIA